MNLSNPKHLCRSQYQDLNSKFEVYFYANIQVSLKKRLDDIEKLVKDKQKMLAAIPSIQPGGQLVIGLDFYFENPRGSGSPGPFEIK